MRINSNGTVGIGSGSRTDQMLMIQGAAPQIEVINTSNSYSALSFVNNTNTNSYNDIASIGAEIDSGSAKGRIVFKTRNTDGSGSQAERMRITSTGDFLSNTTTAIGSMYNGVSGIGFGYSSGGYGACVRGGTNTPFYVSTNSQGAGGFIEFAQNGATRGNITYTGSATSYNASSDYRLKRKCCSNTKCTI